MKIYITVAGVDQSNLDIHTFAPGTSAFRTFRETFEKVNRDLETLKADHGGEIVPLLPAGPGRWEAKLISPSCTITFKIQEAELHD